MMYVNPEREATRIAGVPPKARTAAAAPAPQLQPDTVSLAGTEGLDRAWQQTPAVRPEKVAQAKALLTEEAYPSEAVLDKVAALIAEHLPSNR
jgi:hypothetical protein